MGTSKSHRALVQLGPMDLASAAYVPCLGDVFRHLGMRAARPRSGLTEVPRFTVGFPQTVSDIGQPLCRRPTRSTRWSVLVIGLGIACSATAQTPATPANQPPPATPVESPQQVERVEVKDSAARYDARREDTATKIVVTEEEILKYGDTQIADVLKRQPGISVQGSTVQMRGLGAGYVQFLIDGQRPPPGWTLDQLPPSQVERIEIIRAATAEMSTASIAGTINIVLKKTATKSNREWRLGYRQGTGFRLSTTSLIRADRIGDFSYNVNLDLFKNHINFPGVTEESQVDPSGRPISLYVSESSYPGTNERISLTPRLQWSLGGGNNLAWNNNLQVMRGTFRPAWIGRQVVGTPLSVISGDGRSDRERTYAKSEVQWVTTGASGTKLDVKAAAAVTRRELVDSERGFGADGSLTQDWQKTLRNTDREFSSSGKLSLAAINGHAWMTGWEGGMDSVQERETWRELPTTLNALRVTELDASSKVFRLAAFVQDEWNLKEHWSMYAGLRWESVITDMRVESGAASRSRYDVWSPLFQTLWKFPDDKSRQIRIGLTRTYRAPAADELSPRVRYRSNNNSAVEPDYVGNPALAPELATGVDLALEKFWDPGGNVSLALSLRKIRGTMRHSVTLANGRWTGSTVNDGEAEVASLEFDTKFALTSLWKDAPPLDLRMNVGVNRSRISTVPGPNNRLASQNPASASFGVDYRIKGGKFVAGGSLAYRQGSETRTSVNRVVRDQSRRDVDFYGLWKVDPKTTVRLTLSDILREPNVNDIKFIDALGTRGQRVTGTTRMYVRLNLEMKF